MHNIIEKIFYHYYYEEINNTNDNNLKFFIPNDKKIANYFLTKSISFKKGGDLDTLKNELNNLEKKYINFQNSTNNVEVKQELSIKEYLIDTLKSKNLSATSLDKNLSVIFLLEIEDYKILPTLKNLIYSIEESPFYYKRYVLTYTKKQSDELNAILMESKDELDIILSDIMDDMSEYFKQMNDQNSNSLYEFVLKLFAKMPFLKYRFKTNSKPKDLSETIDEIVEKNNLKEYMDFVNEQSVELNDYIECETTSEITDEELEKIISKYKKGGQFNVI